MPNIEVLKKILCSSITISTIEFSISHQPAATVRIRGDGNCFFRALAFVITGSQDEHQELRAITTTYMQHNAGIVSCYLNAHETMDEYLARTDMQISSVWATEVEIFSCSVQYITETYNDVL